MASDSHHYTSAGQVPIYIYSPSQNPPPSIPINPLYRCYDFTYAEYSYVLENTSDCQDAVLLGYDLATANPLSGHWVSTGDAGNGGSGYSKEGTLGYLYTTQQNGTFPLYGCNVANNITHFVTGDPNCEGQVGDDTLGLPKLLGYAFSSPPTGLQTTALYRCQILVNNDQFISADSTCEGQHVAGQVGYALPSAVPAQHWTTTGNAAAVVDYHLEGTLGHLLTTQLSGTVPLYGCFIAGTQEHFASDDAGCEGRLGDDALGFPKVLGYVYSAAQGSNTVLLYRCYISSGAAGDFFVTGSSTCERAGAPQGPLGYALTTPVVADCGGGNFLTQNDVTVGTSDLTNAGLSSDNIALYQSNPCGVSNDTTDIIDQGTVIAGPPQGDFMQYKDAKGNVVGYCGHATLDYRINSHLFLGILLARIHLNQYVCSQGQDLTNGSGGAPPDPDITVIPTLLGNLYGISAITKSHRELGSSGSPNGLLVIDIQVSVSPINPFNGKSARVFDQFYYLDIQKIPNCIGGC